MMRVVPHGTDVLSLAARVLRGLLIVSNVLLHVLGLMAAAWIFYLCWFLLSQL